MSKKYYPSGYQIINLGELEPASYKRSELPDDDWKMLFDILKAGKGVEKPLLIKLSWWDYLLQPSSQYKSYIICIMDLSLGDEDQVDGYQRVKFSYDSEKDELLFEYNER